MSALGLAAWRTALAAFRRLRYSSTPVPLLGDEHPVAPRRASSPLSRLPGARCQERGAVDRSRAAGLGAGDPAALLLRRRLPGRARGAGLCHRGQPWERLPRRAGVRVRPRGSGALAAACGLGGALPGRRLRLRPDARLRPLHLRLGGGGRRPLRPRPRGRRRPRAADRARLLKPRARLGRRAFRPRPLLGGARARGRPARAARGDRRADDSPGPARADDAEPRQRPPGSRARRSHPHLEPGAAPRALRRRSAGARPPPGRLRGGPHRSLCRTRWSRWRRARRRGSIASLRRAPTALL